MRDWYKKLATMSIKDAQSICRDTDFQAEEELAMQLYQTRVKHWHIKSMEEKGLDFPDDPMSMYE